MNKDKPAPVPSGDKNSTKLLFSGVLILTLSNIIVKAIGLLFKIPLNHIVGDDGMGYFNSAYTIYTYLYMVSTAGLPVAISIMISESRVKGSFKQVKRIFLIALLIFVVIGLAGMSLMFFGAKPFAEYVMKSPDTAYCIMAIAPTLFFICIASAMRGYFQGFQQLFPHAVSQVIEAGCKLAVGVVMAVWSIRQGYEIYIVAAYTVTGLTIGSVLSMAFLTVSKLLFKESKYNAEYALNTGTDDDVAPTRTLIRRMILIALPITLSASIPSLTNMIDVIIMQRRLQDIGLTREMANSIYGNYTTLAVPMFNLPPVLIYPISYAIIPYLTAARTIGDRLKMKNIMESTLRIAALIAIPCAIGMCAMSKPILQLVYTAESVELAWPMLSLLAPSVFFVCMLSVTSSFLQACGKEKLPIISMIVGSVVKLAASYILIGIPSVGRYGTPVGTFVCYFSITVLNFYFVARHTGVIPDMLKTFVKPLVLAIVSIGGATAAYYGISRFYSSRIVTLFAILLAAFIYMIAVFRSNAISKDDIMMLPKGDKLSRLLSKLKLLKA